MGIRGCVERRVHVLSLVGPGAGPQPDSRSIQGGDNPTRRGSSGPTGVGKGCRTRPPVEVRSYVSPMSMERAAYNSMYSAMHARNDKRPFTRATLRRILTFARPRRAALIGFVALSVVGAALAVATPLLTGPGRPTAVFANNDLAALGVVEAAGHLGLREIGRAHV